MASGILPHISWSICTVKSHSILQNCFSLLLLACVNTNILSLLSHIFYIYLNGSSFQTNHAVFYTLFGDNLLHSLNTSSTLSSAFPNILHLLFSWVLSIFAFMLLLLIACAATIKASVVLVKHAFLSHPHQSSFALPVVCLMNCRCNCFCVHCVFLLLFFLFLYPFGNS